jgi:hypothetical protein
MPQMQGQGVGLAVAPESKMTFTQVCGNKDGSFCFTVPKEGVASGYSGSRGDL